MGRGLIVGRAPTGGERPAATLKLWETLDSAMELPP